MSKPIGAHQAITAAKIGRLRVLPQNPQAMRQRPEMRMMALGKKVRWANVLLHYMGKKTASRGFDLLRRPEDGATIF